MFYVLTALVVVGIVAIGFKVFANAKRPAKPYDPTAPIPPPQPDNPFEGEPKTVDPWNNEPLP